MCFAIQTKRMVPVLLLLAILFSCGVAKGAERGLITPERAMEIALAHTGGGQVLELDRHYGSGGLGYYRVEVIGNEGRYQVEIGAADGGILKFIKKNGKMRPGAVPVPIAPVGPVVPAPSVPIGGAPLTREQALDMAMQQTGGGVLIESEIDHKRGGRIVYEFAIYNNGTEYEVEIDSFGNMLEFKRKDSRRSLAGAAAAFQPRLDATSAQSLAKGQIGGGDVTEYKLDTDKGRLVHEITLVKDGRRYEFDINDADGMVLEMSVK